ncbi:MAG: protein kinase [Ktedonobacteraceae bacterium]|nr:protein kinase [Ktedonobacteraceae bacterium]
MEAEVLSGTVLGTCTLQKVIGRGGMGAVFLAQQSRPRRQVAVKVLLPMSKLKPSQQAAFLARFRRETDTAASLDHPHILPVHECGERDGMAYLVMPYISGGTLRDELEAQGKLPFPLIVSYLDQIAAALDFAHERGIIHRDIKPANLLMTTEKRLMLTDFGLVKIITDGQQTQSPLSETGMPMGTPDYMSPEQVLGGEIDTRADIYSLGIILYQMVTGSVPFKGEMPMKIAIQHLNTLPPQPRNLRPDLPLQAEQVILRALAKRPADRYMFARDLANAFQRALEMAGIQVGDAVAGAVNNATSAPQASTYSYPTGTRLAKKLLVAHSEQGKATRGTQADTQQTIPPLPQRSRQPFARATHTPAPAEQPTNQVPQIFQFSPSGPTPSQPATNQYDATTPVPAVQFNHVPQRGPSEARSNAFNGEQNSLNIRSHGTRPLAPSDGQSATKGSMAGRPQTMTLSLSESQQPRVTRQLGQDTGMLSASRATGTLQHPVGEYSGDTGMLRLHQPVKVVKVPVAGQPGQYMTGILPVLPQTQTGALPPPSPTPQPEVTFKSKAKQYSKIIILVTVVLVVLFTSGIYLLTRPAAPKANTATRPVGVVNANNPNAAATARISATATAEEANLILDDPLNENFHNWAQGSRPGGLHYEFKNGAYHIRNDGNVTTLAAQFNLSMPAKYSYSLTMQPITGDENSPFNFYGLMLRYSVDKNQIPTFYFFSIINNKDQSKYQFRRYDGHKPKDQNPWVATPFEHNAGKELNKGKQPNTVKIIVDTSHFTFIVNGKQVGDAHDDVYKETGALGMGVNQKGSEVAFTNFRLIRL